MAKIFEIVDRNYDLGGYASLDRFTLCDGGEIESDIVLDNDNISLYCLDHANERVIFVESATEVDYTIVPFIYFTQTDHAIRLIAVSYAELAGLASHVPQPEQLVFIFSVGRTGSTLMNQILNQVDGVVSFSEPDFFTNFVAVAYQTEDRQQLVPLMRHCFQLFARRYGNQKIALKMRSDVIDVADIINVAFPNAKHLFMYRNIPDWAASYWNYYVPNAAGAGLVKVMDIRNFLNTYHGRCPYVETHLLGEHHVSIMVQVMARWLVHIDAFYRVYELGVPLFIFRYEDLAQHSEAMLEKLFDYLDIPQFQVQKAMNGFSDHSQRGEKFSGGNQRRLGNEQMEIIHQMLALHPRRLTVDLALPDITYP